MRLTRFRVASMIAILGCGAALAASLRAQTGTQQSSTTGTTVRSRQTGSSQTGTSQAGTSQAGTSQAGTSQAGTSQPPVIAPLPRQVRELSVPPGATPSPGRKKQVIDLRDRIASVPDALRGNLTSQSQPTQGSSQPSKAWIDSAIPKQLFEQAQIAPQQQLDASPQPQDAPSLDSRAIESVPQVPSPQVPESSQIISQPAQASSGARVNPIVPPELATTEEPAIEEKTSGQTFSPAQAIPNLGESDTQRQEIPVQTRAPRLDNAAPINNSTPSDNRSSTSPGQAIPDWIYGQAGNQQSILDSRTSTPTQAGAGTGANTEAPSLAPVQPEQLPSPINQPRGTTPQQVAPQVTPPVEAEEISPLNALSDLLSNERPATQQPPVSGNPPGESILGQTLTNPAEASPQPSSGNQQPSKADKNSSDPAGYPPNFSIPANQPPESDLLANQVGYFPGDFSDCSGPQGSTFDPNAAAQVYRGKFAVPAQRPLIELWRPLYTGGVYAPAPTWFGVTNPMKPHFMVYGDFRTAAGANHNSTGKSNVWGNVLNLDMDLQLTSTERIHAFVSPLNNGTRASGVSFNDELDLINGTNFNFNTLFFEGDAGALLGGARGTYPPFDLPFTFGLIPLIYQNGIWANDALLGAAVALPARHSRALKWSNFDATLFWATDNVTSDAFPGQDSAADFFGTAWFIDAYEGYIESNYAFVNDNTGAGRSYHNISAAFTRRYFHKLSNSVRFIVNTGQEDLAPINRTADGHLLLIENSLISAYPNTIVPYFNMFYGQGRPQSLARVGIAGGILTNTGINFETDGITGYPTLDPTGSNAYGFASGINMLGSQFTHQLVLEFAMLQAVGSRQLRNAAGDEYGFGVRYQKPLSNNLIFRTDHMVGFREEATNITGSRIELRWKF